MPVLVTGGALVSGVTTRALDPSTGAEAWTANHGAAVRCVAADAAGNVYTGGDRVGGVTTRKYDADGNPLWTADHGGTVWGIAVDSAGNVYTGGYLGSGSMTTRKYTSAGVPITTGWPKNHSDTVWAVCVDSLDRPVAVGAYIAAESLNLRQYGSDGSVGWTALHSTNPFLAVSPLGSSYLVAAGGRNSLDGKTTRIYDASSGTRFYSHDHGATAYGLANGRDASGALDNTYLLGGALVGGVTTRKVQMTTGADVWTANHGAAVRGVAVGGADGAVYTVGLLTGGVTTRKYTAAGAEVMVGWPLNHGADVYAVAWSPYTSGKSRAPGLPLGLGLGLPVSGFAGLAPGLALGLGLGLPACTPAPSPPPLTDGQVLRYRLVLTGGRDWLEWPLTWIQCRRRLGASTWLAVGVPSVTPAMRAELVEARREIVIYAGLAGDAPQWGEFVRGALTEAEPEQDAGVSVLTLTARVLTPAYTRQTRTLRGVRSRGADDGRRTATCEVDPALRPNDLVFDGAATWVAGSIFYRISPADAVMDVTKAAD